MRADRGRAIGAWSGLGSIAAAIGPFVGGGLVQYADWRWIFLINAPIAAVTVVVALKYVPETRAASDGPFDVLGRGAGRDLPRRPHLLADRVAHVARAWPRWSSGSWRASRSSSSSTAPRTR